LSEDPSIRLGVDVGGTFTDLVAVDGEGRITTAKVPSTPRDQAEAVLAVIESSGVEAERVRAFSHGTTVATNALLERRGVTTALVTTEGFRDIIEIGRQNRPSLYDLTEDRPPPLVSRRLRFTVRERSGPKGTLTELDAESLRQVVDELAESDAQAVAVGFLFSFLYPDNERRAGEELRARLNGVHVSLSSEVLPEVREYERLSTAVADAYLSPVLALYLRNVAERATDLGLPSPLVMQSSGGVLDVESAADRAATCVLSGPAGGVVGAAFIAGLGGHHDVLTFDMGGTSTDVAPVVDGEVQTSTESVIAGVPIKFPIVDVHTVSAGGGSIAWVDEGGALQIGPHSAGAEPGPAAYGLGGEEPTVTDANLVLGYLADGAKLGGEVVLDRNAAEQALGRVAKSLDLSIEDTAFGTVRVANAEMVRALRVISVERGLDPREFALVAFGGAGGMHACALAEELDMATVVVPRASGVLSALGLAISDLRRDYVRPCLGALADIAPHDLEEAFDSMEATAADDLDGARFERSIDARYSGQSFELEISAADLDALDDRFHDAHERRYGYRMTDEPVEVVNLRLAAIVDVEKPEVSEPPSDASENDGERDTRRASFDGDWMEVEVLARNDLGSGSEVTGPAIVEFPESTCVVRPGWQGSVDEAGNLVLERSDG
jgi:N-methylhydantoinase A